MLPIGGAAFVLNCGQYICFMVSGERIIMRLKNKLFAQILEQELGYFDVNQSGVLAASIAEQTNLILAGITDKFGTTTTTVRSRAVAPQRTPRR